MGRNADIRVSRSGGFPTSRSSPVSLPERQTRNTRHECLGTCRLESRRYGGEFGGVGGDDERGLALAAGKVLTADDAGFRAVLHFDFLTANHANYANWKMLFRVVRVVRGSNCPAADFRPTLAKRRHTLEVPPTSVRGKKSAASLARRRWKTSHQHQAGCALN